MHRFCKSVNRKILHEALTFTAQKVSLFGVSLRIHSECRKIRKNADQNNSVQVYYQLHDMQSQFHSLPKKEILNNKRSIVALFQQTTAELVTFTEEILNKQKTSFLCSVDCQSATNNISFSKLYIELILVLYFLFDRALSISFKVTKNEIFY